MPNATLTVASSTLGPKDSPTMCTTYSGTYIPLAPDAGTSTAFSDAVTARGTPPAITGVTEVVTPFDAPATCNLCPTGVCLMSNGTDVRSMLKSSDSKK